MPSNSNPIGAIKQSSSPLQLALGRKIGQEVDHEEHLILNPYMSEDQYGPTYSLYGVICHAQVNPVQTRTCSSIFRQRARN